MSELQGSSFPGHSSRYGLLAAAGAATVLGLVAYSCFYERQHLEVTHHTIFVDRLPAALDGLRLAHLTDLHHKHFAEAYYLRRVVEEVNRLAPDLVLLTGDFVSELRFGTRLRSSLNSVPCANILAGLQCAHRWAVLGNHDALVDPAVITHNLEMHGFPVLNNAFAAFERNGARLWIAGVRSSTEDHPDLHAAVPAEMLESADPVLLLAHEPDFADQVVLHGPVDLMLSGHTHGGQVRLPLLGAAKLPRGGRKYVEGLFRFPNGMQLYVNRGIGSMKLPIRFRCRPEIAMLTLRRG
jgi:predicted MPP superfamily phosphohydrolase